jgi:hypothetical protein
MSRSTPSAAPATSAAYANLRYEGFPPPRAQAELGLAEGRAAKLERMFLNRPGGPQSQRPRFARHAAHVSAVLSAGGFPVLRRP